MLLVQEVTLAGRDPGSFVDEEVRVRPPTETKGTAVRSRRNGRRAVTMSSRCAPKASQVVASIVPATQ